MTRPTTAEIVRSAWHAGRAVPGFNVSYLPMMAPIVSALRDTNSFGLIMVARPDWMKFEAKGPGSVRQEYERCGDPAHTRLHLDHVPVIDEDGERVDFEGILEAALRLGYGSRLPLGENIAETRRAAELSHAAGVPTEAELGAVFGHENGSPPPYEALFASGRGFTDPDEARRFVRETGVDWLSVAIGNIHGAISEARRGEKKVRARLNIEHLKKIRDAAGVPLVLHGGSGIRKPYLMEAFHHGIAKINVGTTIRQAYEAARGESVSKARSAVYKTMVRIICEELETQGLADLLAV